MFNKISINHKIRKHTAEQLHKEFTVQNCTTIKHFPCEFFLRSEITDQVITDQ